MYARSANDGLVPEEHGCEKDDQEAVAAHALQEVSPNEVIDQPDGHVRSASIWLVETEYR